MTTEFLDFTCSIAGDLCVDEYEDREMDLAKHPDGSREFVGGEATHIEGATAKELG